MGEASRIHTGRNRFSAVSFVTASIQHDALQESPAFQGVARCSQTQAMPHNDHGAKNTTAVIKKLLHDKKERP
jgi:hypothetical protein